MASYKLFIKASAEKELCLISEPFRRQVVAEIMALAEVPRPFGVKLLKGEERHYRLRQGDYRVLYEVDDSAQAITVVKIGHRREVYDF